jgi:hypothetical protein
MNCIQINHGSAWRRTFALLKLNFLTKNVKNHFTTTNKGNYVL